jgi:hypothetical protein
MKRTKDKEMCNLYILKFWMAATEKIYKICKLCSAEFYRFLFTFLMLPPIGSKLFPLGWRVAHWHLRGSYRLSIDIYRPSIGLYIYRPCRIKSKIIYFINIFIPLHSRNLQRPPGNVNHKIFFLITNVVPK